MSGLAFPSASASSEGIVGIVTREGRVGSAEEELEGIDQIAGMEVIFVT